MSRTCFPLALALLLAVAGAAPARADLDYRGMAVGLWDKSDAASYTRQFAEVKALGANAVLLSVLNYTDTVTGTRVYRREGWTTPDAVLRRAITDAHAAGLRVMLMPVIRIEHRVDREWRGQLAPTDRDAFFDSYARMLEHYATLAQDTGVELFLVGSELGSLETAPHWRPLIAQIRGVYSGTLSYSANWDHYEHVPFWDQLDLLALTGYYELSRTPTPTQAQLTASWRAVRERVVDWRARQGNKPLIFTEVGYPAQDGCSMTPWDNTLTHPIDQDEQRMCYAAVLET